MYRVAWLVLFASACGRLGFESARQSDADARPPCVAPDPHDEDGDTFADGCDVCPHLPDDQLDTDGDQVGDACDPEPANGRQRIVLFDPFTSLDPGWTVAVEARVENDELVIGMVGADKGGVLERPLVATADTFIVAGSAGAAGAGQHLFIISTAPADPPGSAYCELYDGGTDTNLFYTVTYDNTSYAHPAAAPMPRLGGGEGTLSYAVDATTARCASTWRGIDGVATAPRATDVPSEVLLLYAENIVMRLRYFVQIRTEP